MSAVPQDDRETARRHGLAPAVNVSPFLSRLPLVLELGCGTSKRSTTSVGIDLVRGPDVDIVGDALAVLRSFPDGSVDAIYSEHFLEHIENPRGIVEEGARVLKPGGQFRAVVPHFSNPWFYSDPTHRAFFGLYTFAYWIETTNFRRDVPHYETPLPFSLVDATHRFKSARPFFGRHAVKKILSSWVNLNRWTQELYEELFTAVIPCHEVDFVLQRT